MTKPLHRAGLLGAVLVIFAASGFAQSGPSNVDWKQTLQERLALYGHRNWIVIADAAYPAQTNPGIETIVSHADQAEVLQEVLHDVAQSKSVRPIVYLDKELKYVDEKDAQGVEAFRTQLAVLLQNQEQHSMLHEQLIAKLGQVSKDFRVLIIKTNLTVPYTTVFLELRASYWSDDAERRLRSTMSKQTSK